MIWIFLLYSQSMLCNRSVRAIKSRLVWEFEINSESRIDISDEFPVPLEIL